MRRLISLVLFLLHPIDLVERTYYKQATYYQVTPTKYYPTGRNTADNTKINLKQLDKGSLRFVALSRDLFTNFRFGDTIRVYCKNKFLSGKWIVKDKMNKRFSNRIDFLFSNKNKSAVDNSEKILVSKN